MKLSDLDPKDIKIITPNKKHFQDTIRKMESSGKYDVLGQPIEYGVSKGKQAIGAYQFTPETIDTIAKLSKDKELKQLQNLSDEEKQQVLFSNPKLQDKLFEEHSERVFDLAGGDPLKAAWAWNQGPGAISKFKEEHEYVQKYKKLSGMKDRDVASKPLRLSDLKDGDIKVVEENQPEVEPAYSELQSAGLGALQGASFGFADELEAAIRAGALSGPQYESLRNKIRERYKEAEAINPKSFLGGNIAGGVGSSLIPGLNIAKGATVGKAALMGAGLGGIAGLGASEAETVGGLATDTGLGMALGGATGAAGQKLAQALTPAATEARAVTRATKALGQKAIPENLPAGQAVLDEGLLNITGGSPKLLENITGKMTQLEQEVVQPTLSAVSENAGKKSATEWLPDFAKSHININEYNKSKNTVLKNIDILKDLLKNATTEEEQMLVAKNLIVAKNELKRLTDQFKQHGTDIIGDIANKVKQQIPDDELANASIRGVNKSVNFWRNKIERAGKDPKLLNNLRRKLDNQINEMSSVAFKTDNIKPKLQFLKDLRFELNEYLRYSAGLISEGAGQDLTEAMGRQSKLYAPIEAAEKLVEKDIASSPGSIMDIIRNPLTNPRALGAGASTLLHSPLPAAGAVATIATEKATKHPIGRLGNIISAKSQYALSKAPKTLATASAIAKGASTAARTSGVQSNIQSIYTSPSNKVMEVADAFRQSPGGENIGNALAKAVESNNNEAKDKALFALMQNPNHRAKLEQLLKVQEEQDENQLDELELEAIKNES